MEFSISRFINLIKRDFYLYKKPVGLLILSVFVLLGIIMLLPTIGTPEESTRVLNDRGELTMVLSVIFLVAGLVFTSVNFWEFKTHFGRHNYLTLPASHLEKWLSHFFYTTIGYLGIGYLVYRFTYTFFAWIAETLTHAHYAPFQFFTEPEFYTYGIRTWIVGHGVVFICSIIFNRFAPVKTVIVTFLIWLAIIFIGVFIAYIVFFDHVENWNLSFGAEYQPSDAWVEWTSTKLGPTLLKLLFYAVPPFLWMVSYFKLTEKEA